MVNAGNPPNRIFICYRREDSAGVAGRIYDRLAQTFGRNAVFKDVDSIPLGINFRDYIDSAVNRCDLVLVVIGKRWVEATDKDGSRRLDDAEDSVRVEIETALRRNIPIIPLLVQNASMPPRASLPPSLKELTYRNGMSVSDDPHFHADMNRLINYLESFPVGGVARPGSLTRSSLSSPEAQASSGHLESAGSGAVTPPSKGSSPDSQSAPAPDLKGKPRTYKVAAISFLLLLTALGIYLFKSREPSKASPAVPELTLRYNFTAIVGEQVFDTYTLGNMVTGTKVTLNFSSPQEGFLYLLNYSKESGAQNKFVKIFPTSRLNDNSAQIQPNQTVYLPPETRQRTILRCSARQARSSYGWSGQRAR